MDITDKKILEILAEDASTSATEIGRLVNLSVPAVNKRIQRLQGEGIIERFTVVTDAKKTGKTITAFVFVQMQYGESVKALIKYVKDEADILECCSITGEYDYILKICAKDIESLEDKILEIKGIKGVIKSHTMISLMEHKFSPAVLPDMEN